jgi:hypothetical protein
MTHGQEGANRRLAPGYRNYYQSVPKKNLRLLSRGYEQSPHGKEKKEKKPYLYLLCIG